MVAAILEVESVDEFQVVKVDFAETQVVGGLGQDQTAEATHVVKIGRGEKPESKAPGIQADGGRALCSA